MPTKFWIDPKLIARALELSGKQTKQTAVTLALEEFIARRQQRSLLELMSQLEWDRDYDYKQERQRS